VSLSIEVGPPLAEEPGLGELTLPGFLRAVTTRYRDREALVFGETRWSYADLWERSVEVARALRSLDVGKDTRVGVLMTNRPEWLATVFGTALAGGVAVPLSTFSTPAELDHLLAASCVSVLLVERFVARRDFADVLAGFGLEGYPFLRHVALLGEEFAGLESYEAFLGRASAVPNHDIDSTAATTNPSDLAAIFFSSGSTSRPKGILNSHRGIAIQCWRFARMYGLGPEETVRCWSANGFFWSGNFGMALGSTLASGGSLVLQRMFEATEALSLMAAERVTFPVAWPHQWAQLAGAPNFLEVDLSSVVYIDRHMALARHPTIHTDYTEPGHAYGNTETFTISTAYPANTPDEVHQGSSGVPLPGNTVKIVDPVSGSVVPRGEAGEICVKGPTLMLGYLGVPADETLDPEGFFPTGDGGRLDSDGRLYWEGRLTDIIKTGGANVSPLEVDEALAAYPGVKLVRTVGIPHDTLGELVVACIAPHAGVTLDDAKLQAHAREHLASYKVPRAFVFLSDSDFTTTGSNKLKTADLRTLAAARLASDSAVV
jgi:fatty-acyl-CoA synthase